jgi:hypothetical protein
MPGVLEVQPVALEIECSNIPRPIGNEKDLPFLEHGPIEDGPGWSGGHEKLEVRR